MSRRIYNNYRQLIAFARTLIVLTFFFLFAIYLGCNKDQFPRITKFKLTSYANCPNDKYLEIIDLSEAMHSQCGVQYSGNKTFDKDSVLFTKNNPKKPGYCVAINFSKCQSKIYLRPFCYEANDIKFGEIDSIGGGSSYKLGMPTIDEIDTSKKPEIHITYSIPNDPLSLIEKVLLCFNVDPSKSVTVNDSPKLIANRGKGFIDTLKVAAYNVNYNYKLFIIYCNKLDSSLTKSFRITNPSSSSCNPTIGYLSWQQKSPTKILVTGSLTPLSNLKDWGFCEGSNCTPKYSMMNMSASKFEAILSASPSTIKSIQIYYECTNNLIGQGLPVSVEFKTPTLSKPVLTYSSNILKMQSTFNITNYLSKSYGFCYSNLNAIPTQSDLVDSIGVSVIQSFEKSISVQNGKTYYVRSFVKDCDGIRYSETASFVVPSSVDPCNLSISSIDFFPGNGNKNAASFFINNEIYIGGGTNSIGGTKPIDLFYRYIDSLKKWDTLPKMPIEYRDDGGIAAFFTINDYAFFMENGRTPVQRYDYRSNSWDSKSDAIPTGNIRRDQGSASSKAKGYILGGKYPQTSSPYLDFFEFDPSQPKGMQWKKLGWDSDIGERINPSLVYLDSSVYLIGGNIQKNDFWQYLITSDKWMKNPNGILPTALSGFDRGTLFAKNGLIYAAKQNSSSLWFYDPNNGWNQCRTNPILGLTNRQYGINTYNGNVVYLGLGKDKEVYIMQ